MIKYYCDKCGKEIDQNIRFGGYPGTNQLHEIKFITPRETAIHAYEHTIKNICLDCYFKYSKLVETFIEEK
jgi:hypothetical protein